MKFVFIDDLELNITFDLLALERNSQRYSILLYQHEGTLEANENKIGNSLQSSIQFDKFFEKAKEKNTDLALTPEYSCPWEVINNIVPNPEKWPSEGKLWIIGCESISKEFIQDFKTKFNQDSSLVYYDESVLGDNKNFLDPLVYIFKVQHEDVSKLFILIQFKTIHMGVWSGGAIERNNLIQGKEVYILRNDANSIYCMSLICSDVLSFRDELTQEKKEVLDWEDKPFLIFNPQLNPNPIHDEFISFRKYIFQYSDKEIISLNWQLNSKIGANNMIQDNCSRSGFYLKSNEINFSDRHRIIKNHKKGLYYFNNKKNRHTYLLNSSPHCFLVETPRVKISNAQPAQIRRDGPELMELYCLNEAKDSFEINEYISDQHIEYITGLGCQNEFLLDETKCILEKERLLCLSTGNVNKINGKWLIDNINSIVMDENREINGRFTVAQDPNTESIQIKTKFIETVEELKSILDGKQFPDSLHDLKKEDVILGYYSDSHLDEYKYNVTLSSGEMKPATVSYVGLSPDDVVEKTFSNLRQLFDRKNKDIERVVVFYKRGDEIKARSDLDAGVITKTNDTDDTSILKESL